MGTHRHGAWAGAHLGCAVVTVSDTRTPADDVSGGEIRRALTEAGHSVTSSTIVRDEPEAIRSQVAEAAKSEAVAAIVVTGGTGIAPRDVTIESLAPLWSKELPGFGEIFRALSYAEVGPAAFLSRATAGVIAGKFVVVLPGSPSACRLALERLVLPELGHVAALLGTSA